MSLNNKFLANSPIAPSRILSNGNAATPKEFKRIIPEVSPATALHRLREGALLVDVRNSAEIESAAYDVPDIVVLPLPEFEDRYAELPPDRELIIACRGGVRSARATNFLLGKGYERVSNLAGGILRWFAEGLPTTGNPNH